MNETDKMLADMLASLEKNKNTKKETTEKAGGDEISLLLSDLKKQTNVISSEFIFIDCSEEKKLKSFYICNHQVTQKEFEDVMGINPSRFQIGNSELGVNKREQLEKEGTTENHPVESVSWFDAIYYCNKRSIMEGLTPVYKMDGTTNIGKWKYVPCRGNAPQVKVTKNIKADGYRLPTVDEWEYAAKGKEKFKYSGSDNIDEVAWYGFNSKGVTHPVMQKKANGYGLYDMSGNVWEWCWDVNPYSGLRYYCGGSYYYNECHCEVGSRRDSYASDQNNRIGFRIVRSPSSR